jgi:hypothetical protein
MKSEMKFRLEWRGAQWAIVDPDNVNALVPFDQAIVDATLVQQGLVEGYITSIHGLGADIADLCDGETLRALGVGAQLVSQKPPSCIRAKGMQRVRLMEDGTVERITRA